jgi:hypothetical protein
LDSSKSSCRNINGSGKLVLYNITHMHGSLGNQAERMADPPSTVEPELGNASGGMFLTPRNGVRVCSRTLFLHLRLASHGSVRRFFVTRLLRLPQGSHHVQP